jgi:hypothetical protein
MALLETKEEPYTQHRIRHEYYDNASYANLVTYSMLNMDLSNSRRHQYGPSQTMEREMLDCAMHLPIMFETAGDGKRIPRIAPILTQELLKELSYIKRCGFGNDVLHTLPRQYGVLRIAQRGFLPHYMAGLLDANHILPLKHLVPYLPDRHRRIYVRVSAITPHIQSQSTSQRRSHLPRTRQPKMKAAATRTRLMTTTRPPVSFGTRNKRYVARC